MRKTSSVLLVFAVVLTLLPAAASDEKPANGKPRLAVLVVFDQMRGDYVSRWEKLFGEGGFRRLQKDGAWFQNCHYPYAYTLTAPGHASLSTGTSPYKHGIIANDWYDRATGKMIGAVQSDRHRPVPPPPDTGKLIPGASPERRRRPTLGDSLLEATGGKGKVVSLSLKDRAAILLAALRALCLWFSTNAGNFVSSTYYGDTLPSWVTEFNRGRMADRWFGRDWTRLVPELDYTRFSGPDDVAAEGIGFAQGRTFPHPMTGGSVKLGRAYYQAMTVSPYGSELLLALAKKAIDAEQLGQDDIPDLLCLSFSSTDLVGHCWGPDSQEVLDVTLHSDRVVKELLDYLDAKVGKGRYIIGVTADHGVCPIPEVARRQGKDAGRISPELFTSGANAFLQDKFGNGRGKLPWIEAAVSNNIYLNRAVLAEQGLKQADVENELAAWLSKQPGIQAAYSRTQLASGPIAGDAIAESVRRSFHPECSGDVLFVPQPYHLVSPPISSPRMAAYRTTHGSPHPYDTHVPLLIYGPGVRPGTHSERVLPQSLPAILARALGVPPPKGAEAPVPGGLFD
jgi:predicted AlkP superfamily pyrophosphatase or phosphodiesterase